MTNSQELHEPTLETAVDAAKNIAADDFETGYQPTNNIDIKKSYERFANNITKRVGSVLLIGSLAFTTVACGNAETTEPSPSASETVGSEFSNLLSDAEREAITQDVKDRLSVEKLGNDVDKIIAAYAGVVTDTYNSASHPDNNRASTEAAFSSTDGSIRTLDDYLRTVVLPNRTMPYIDSQLVGDDPSILEAKDRTLNVARNVADLNVINNKYERYSEIHAESTPRWSDDGQSFAIDVLEVNTDNDDDPNDKIDGLDEFKVTATLTFKIVDGSWAVVKMSNN